MKKNLLYMMAASAMMMLLGGCASDIIEADNSTEQSSSTTSGANTVTFTLSTSSGAVSRTVYQTDDESKISTLLAVVFNDVSKGAVNGESSTGDTSDTFYKCFELSDDDGDGTYSFTVSEATTKGYYQFCLVANADDDLVDKIEGLTSGTSKLSDFQSLVVTQDPEEMLMSSEYFYGIVTPTEETIEIGEINLIRLMARIDILNLAENITITGVTLKNRAKRCLLDNTDQATYSEELTVDGDSYLEDKDYGTVEIEYGEENAYSSVVYSYEQYETEDYPVMTLTYIVTYEEDKVYTQDIEFLDSDENAITLKPNYHYFVAVKLSGSDSNLTFTLTASDNWDVEDWNEGETINVKEYDITSSASAVAAGSILMSDGTVMAASEVTSSSASPIGIVYTTDATRIGEYTKQALGGTATGLALALYNAAGNTEKNSSTGTSKDYNIAKWSVYSDSTTYVNVSGITDTPLVSDAYLDYDGYYNSVTVWGLDDYMPTTASDETYEPSSGVYTNYPAFYFAQKYNETVPVPSSSEILTTKWYLPTQGEWYDILSNIGKISDDVIDWKTASASSYNMRDNNDKYSTPPTPRETAAYNINMAMYKVAGVDSNGDYNFDPIPFYASYSDYQDAPGASSSLGDRCWFQTSSEVDEDDSRIIYFNSNSSSNLGLDIDTELKSKERTCGYVRCAIAFRLL